MRSDDPRDQDRRDPSLFDDNSRDDVPRDKPRGETPADVPRDVFEDELEEESAQELRYEGPISMDGHDDEFEDESGGGGRLLVTAAIVIGAVIVIVAVAMMMKSGGEAGSEGFAENRPAEVAALGEGAGADEKGDDAGALGEQSAASIDYRAIPDGDAGDQEEPLALADDIPAQSARTTPPETTARAPVAPRVERSQPVPARQVTNAAGASVGELAREGRVREAAALGRSLLASASASHTLQVLYSCEATNVQKAFRRVTDAELTVVPAGECFRVCFGTFDSHAAASAAKGQVPGYFAGAGAFPKALDELSLR